MAARVVGWGCQRKPCPHAIIILGLSRSIVYYFWLRERYRKRRQIVPELERRQLELQPNSKYCTHTQTFSLSLYILLVLLPCMHACTRLARRATSLLPLVDLHHTYQATKWTENERKDTQSSRSNKAGGKKLLQNQVMFQLTRITAQTYFVDFFLELRLDAPKDACKTWRLR